jgi:hypothetical protein
VPTTKRFNKCESKAPLPIRAIGALDAHQDIAKFIGQRFGNLKCLGMGFNVKRAGKKNSCAMWVCRCDCGVYVQRTLAAIRNPANDEDACEQCRHLKTLKRSDLFRRTGRDVERRDLPGAPSQTKRPLQ